MQNFIKCLKLDKINKLQLKILEKNFDDFRKSWITFLEWFLVVVINLICYFSCIL